MNVNEQLPGSARLQRAGDGILPLRTFLGGSRYLLTNERLGGRLFRRNTETSTPEARAPQTKGLRTQRTYKP